MEQLRADASVPCPVLVAQSIQCSGCSAVGCASSGIFLVYVPIYTPLLFFPHRWRIKAWSHPHTMTIAIFYVLSRESDQRWKSCTGWGRWRARRFAIVACQIRVGCSFGHHILEYVFPGGHCKRILVSILFPDAVKISDMNSSWSEICTLLSRRSISPVYSALSRACIIN